MPLAFIGLGLFSIATVLSGRPWTAEFSRAAYPGADENPVFVLVNMILSALWGVLFLLLALAHALKAGGIVTTGIVVVGSRGVDPRAGIPGADGAGAANARA